MEDKKIKIRLRMVIIKNGKLLVTFDSEQDYYRKIIKKVFSTLGSMLEEWMGFGSEGSSAIKYNSILFQKAPVSLYHLNPES